MDPDVVPWLAIASLKLSLRKPQSVLEPMVVQVLLSALKYAVTVESSFTSFSQIGFVLTLAQLLYGTSTALLFCSFTSATALVEPSRCFFSSAT